MPKFDDPAGRFSQIALGQKQLDSRLGGAPEPLAGLGLYERMQREHLRFSELLARRPDIFEEMSRRQQTFSEVLAKRPTIFEDMAKQQASFVNFINGGGLATAAGHLAVLEKASASVQRLADALPNREAYERLIGGRSLIPDHVINALALRAPLNPLVERLSGYQTEIGRRFAEQMTPAFLAFQWRSRDQYSQHSGWWPDGRRRRIPKSLMRRSYS